MRRVSRRRVLMAAAAQWRRDFSRAGMDFLAVSFAPGQCVEIANWLESVERAEGGGFGLVAAAAERERELSGWVARIEFLAK